MSGGCIYINLARTPHSHIFQSRFLSAFNIWSGKALGVNQRAVKKLCKMRGLFGNLFGDSYGFSDCLHSGNSSDVCSSAASAAAAASAGCWRCFCRRSYSSGYRLKVKLERFYFDYFH